ANKLVAAYGDALYPLCFTFTSEEAMDHALLSAENEKNELDINETVKLIPTLYNLAGNVINYTPESITSISYFSDNANVATVDQNGVVTAHNEGKATITATIVRDGTTATASIEISVKDNSGINTEYDITASAAESIYVYGKTAISVLCIMNSGKTITIPSEYITYQMSGDSDAIEIAEDGTVTGKNVGTVHIQPIIDAEYLESRGGASMSVSPITVSVVWDATVDPKLYTLRERENAKENAERYDWARSEVKAITAKADIYVENIDKLYGMIVPEGLPRYYHTTHVNDPLVVCCHYCGEFIGAYSWDVNPITNPWKIQCKNCKRLFPSNDFGSFYELGICEDKSWSYEKALLEHHKLFVCENGESCECPLPKGVKGSAEWYSFYGYGVLGGYLNNDLYKEMDEKLGVTGWGVDDGFGYLQPYVEDKTLPGYHSSYYKNSLGNAMYNNSGLEGPVRHNYIAYYLHEAVWYGVGGKSNSGIIKNALNTLRDAFVYTGEAKYGRAGAILLDRVADVYPEFDWYQWTDWRGNNYRGTIVDAVWSTHMANACSMAYDAFLPIYNDPYVINYLSGHGAVYESNGDGTLKRDENGNPIPVNLKDSPGALRRHIEDNILLKVFEYAKKGAIWGNTGTHQNSVTYAAVALNRMPETGEMLDWIMAMGVGTNAGAYNEESISGGAIMSKLVDDVDRDGSGNENAPGYNSMWISYFMELAGTLAEYDGYEGVNLFENPKYRKMFLAQIRLLLGGYYTAQIGDWGSIGGAGIVLDLEDSVTAFKYTGDRELARAMYLANGNKADGLRGSILDDDPERITKDIERIVEEDGELSLPSDMMTGTGFAALRDGAKYNSASTSTANNTTRDMAMYFGSNNGHGHYDTLNLYMTAFGINVAPDIGYPEFTGSDPNRMQWVHTTLSHNTVVVDEKESDTVTKVSGTPHHFDDSGRVKVMDAEGYSYKNCDEYRRSVIMVEVDDETAYGVDFFHIVGGDDHLYSFHSQSDELYEVSGLSDKTEQPTYKNEDGELVGT
ncbi:MAG: heparinase II/III family protein, partial [Oscillospiraceae bacterium]|nr:heparinase II/III family protein [Oscillospiraceae bacterium]